MRAECCYLREDGKMPRHHEVMVKWAIAALIAAALPVGVLQFYQFLERWPGAAASAMRASLRASWRSI